MWRLVSKRELLLWSATVADLKLENKRLQELAENEKKRAEAAINALLAKSAGLVINTTHEPTTKEINELQRAAFDLFDEGDEIKEQAERMEKMQS